MELEFRKPTLEDKERIDYYYRQANSRSCEDTFANLYLWNRMYPTEFAIVKDMMVLKSAGKDFFFRFPKGSLEHVKEVVEIMADYAREQNCPFKMGVVTPAQFETLEELFPGRFQVTYNRDDADYVYEREKLANLSGKKYHGKKNHVNKFLRMHPDWKFEPITDENVEECFQMALIWRNENGCDEEGGKLAEMCVTLNSLRLMKELKLTGACLRVDGRVVAFTVGEPLCDDTYVVHIEKALTQIEGAYPMINQQFVKMAMEDFLYVNREEDTGDEGLRQAKLSYRPAFLVEKGIVTERQEMEGAEITG